MSHARKFCHKTSFRLLIAEEWCIVLARDTKLEESRDEALRLYITGVARNPTDRVLGGGRPPNEGEGERDASQPS